MENNIFKLDKNKLEKELNSIDSVEFKKCFSREPDIVVHMGNRKIKKVEVLNMENVKVPK